MDFYSSSKLKNFTLEVVICSILMLLMVSWSTFLLIIPVVVTLRELIDFRLSTHYVFIIGNLIVIIVIVQSSKMSGHKTELSSDDLKISRAKVAQGGDRAETRNGALLDEDAKKVKNVVKEKVVMIPECSQLYRRTISASYEQGIRPNRMTRGELRRLSTVKCGAGGGGGSGGGKNFDDLSHEEFRRKIDTFIAKQQRLIRRM